jgi:hypothetical protein
VQLQDVQHRQLQGLALDLVALNIARGGGEWDAGGKCFQHPMLAQWGLAIADLLQLLKVLSQRFQISALYVCRIAVLSVDMADESGKFITDSSTAGIDFMKLHKQRLSKLGKSEHKEDYKLPEPDVVSIIGGMLISDSKQVCSSH